MFGCLGQNSNPKFGYLGQISNLLNRKDNIFCFVLMLLDPKETGTKASGFYSNFLIFSRYTKQSDISRARVWFFEGKRKIMLYTERAHFYHRYKVMLCLWAYTLSFYHIFWVVGPYPNTCLSHFLLIPAIIVNNLYYHEGTALLSH